MHHCREAVVTGLTAVDVIIGMNFFLFLIGFWSKDLWCSSCYYLVRIHVWLCTWTCLPNNQRKVTIEFTVDNLLWSFYYCLCWMDWDIPKVESNPKWRLTIAADFLRIPKAWIMGVGIRSYYLAILKLSSDLWVCAIQYLSIGTYILPKVSFSVLYMCLR